MARWNLPPALLVPLLLVLAGCGSDEATPTVTEDATPPETVAEESSPVIADQPDANADSASKSHTATTTTTQPPVPLHGVGVAPLISPDGHWSVVVSRKKPRLFDLTTRSRVTLPEPNKETARNIEASRGNTMGDPFLQWPQSIATFSPDGTQLAYPIEFANPMIAIWNLPPSGPPKLYPFGRDASLDLDARSDRTLQHWNSLTWLPDGRLLVQFTRSIFMIRPGDYTMPAPDHPVAEDAPERPAGFLWKAERGETEFDMIHGPLQVVGDLGYAAVRALNVETPLRGRLIRVDLASGAIEFVHPETIQFEHYGGGSAVSLDGTLVAVATADGSKRQPMRVFDLTTGEQLHELTPNSSYRVNAMTFDPDGRLFVADGRELTVYDMPAGTVISSGRPSPGPGPGSFTVFDDMTTVPGLPGVIGTVRLGKQGGLRYFDERGDLQPFPELPPTTN